jgi:hypothetical protein
MPWMPAMPATVCPAMPGITPLVSHYARARVCAPRPVLQQYARAHVRTSISDYSIGTKCGGPLYSIVSKKLKKLSYTSSSLK